MSVFLSEIHVAVAVSDPFFVIVCVLPVKRGYCGHFPFTSDAVWFCKSLRWRLQKPFCKSCGYSRLKITAKRLFQNASSVKLQQKGTKKQPNVRLFGEFHFHLFRSHCLKSHVFRATRSGDSADFVLHAFDRPHFSRSGRFCLSSLFLVLGIGLFNLGADVATSPMGEPNRLRSHQITQTFCVAFSVFLLRVAYCRVDVTPFRRVQHLTIFYLERGRLTRGISCERVYTL